MDSAEPAVIFLHIPKTGGTTLQHILRRSYPRNEICTFKDANRESQIENFKRLSAGERARYRLIQGHLSFGFHHHLNGDSIYITLLREPISRVLSFYHYAQSDPAHYLHPLLTSDHVDLKTLLKERTVTTLELFNLQTSMIAGEEYHDPERPADRAALEGAKKNLQHHFVVGLTEEFDASVRRMGQLFGWNVGAYRKKNVTRRKRVTEAFDHETISLLHEANALDIELYQFARELFETQRASANDATAALTSSRPD